MGVVSRVIYNRTLNETFRVTFQAILLYASPWEARLAHELLLTVSIQTTIISPHVIVCAHQSHFWLSVKMFFWKVKEFGNTTVSIFISLFPLSGRVSRQIYLTFWNEEHQGTEHKMQKSSHLPSHKKAHQQIQKKNKKSTHYTHRPHK